MNVNVHGLHAAITAAPTRTPTSDRASESNRSRSSCLPEAVPFSDVPEVVPFREHEGLQPVQAEKILVQEMTVHTADNGREYSLRQCEVA